MSGDRIEIADPDPDWPRAFAAERQRIEAALDGVAWLAIEHNGSTAVPGLPAKFSAWEAPTDPKAPLLGQHNEDVLSGVLGLDAAEIAGLYDAGVLVRDPLLDRKD